MWNADPLKRPKGNELYDLLRDLYSPSTYQSDHEISKQIEVADKINENRLLDFKNLPEPKNAIDNKDDLENIQNQ
ncbi:hypothetical protein C1646_766837 [Rhizophagus diaphanus]|nr:hypothetical protein C1646_766837 [Rhizophagus diaphanus] [Rhizophagus sp. MUCL 43196]